MNRLVKNCKKCLRNKPVNEVVLWNWNDEDYSIDNFFLACDDCCEELCNLYMMRSDKKVDITEIHQSSQEGLETIPFDWIERNESIVRSADSESQRDDTGGSFSFRKEGEQRDF